MSKLEQQVSRYIDYKHNIGIQFKIEGQELMRFVRFAETARRADESLSYSLAMDWISAKKCISDWYAARRYETLQGFAKYIILYDPDAEMLPPQRFNPHGRTEPYILSEGEIVLMCSELSTLHTVDGLRALTIPAMVGLMWATGMRPAEPLRLTNEDIDLTNNVIIIRETKFSKSRLVPIDKTTSQHLKRYVIQRDWLLFGRPCELFFFGDKGKSINIRAFENAWQLKRNCLLKDGSSSWNRRPVRLYDIRHSFITRSILNWVNQDLDANSMMAVLSTYVGHAKVADTYWYITGTPELLKAGAEKFHRYCGGVQW